MAIHVYAIGSRPWTVSWLPEPVSGLRNRPIFLCVSRKYCQPIESARKSQTRRQDLQTLSLSSVA